MNLNTHVRLFYLVLATLAIFISACTRKASTEGFSKISLSFPENTSSNKSVNSNKATEYQLSKSNGFSQKPGFDNSNVPTNYDSIDCFAVFVGGPEDILNNKSCFNTDKSHSFKFGLVTGTVEKGRSAVLEIPSGPDRYILIYGLKKPTNNPSATCPQIIENQSGGDDAFSGFSKPYFLGEVGRLQLEAGTTKIVEIPIITQSIDTTNYIDDCQGLGGSDGTNPGPSQPSGPYLRFEIGNTFYDSVLDKYKTTQNLCYPIKPSLFIGQGDQYILPPGESVTINNLNQIPFAQFYSDSNCTTANTVSSATIAPLTNSTGLYFKPLALGDNLTFVNVSIVPTNTSLNINFDLNSNKVQVGKKQLVLSGPTKISADTTACIPYSISIEKFEGGSLPYDPTPYSISLSSIASTFVVSSLYDCTPVSNDSISLLSNQTSNVFFRLQSAQNLNLANYVVSSNSSLDTQNFPIVIGAGSNVADAVDFSFENSIIENGTCVPAKLTLVNADRSAVTAKAPLDIRVEIPQGKGLVYLSPSCNGPIESVQINTGEIEKRFFIKFTTLQSSLNMKIYGSGYKLYGVGLDSQSVYTVGSIVPTKDPYSLVIYPPSFNEALIVGSHEFNFPGIYQNILIPITYGAGGVLECSTDNVSWSQCTSQISGSNYVWNSTDAINNTSKFMRANYSGVYRYVTLNNTELYGPRFKVVLCNGTAGSGAGQTINNLISILTTLNTLCLPANTTYTRSSTSENIVLTANKQLVGHSSMTSILDGGNYYNSVITANSIDIGSGIGINNISFQNVNGNSVSVINFSSLTAAAPAQIRVNNIALDLVSTSTNNKAINFLNMNSPYIVTNIENSKLSTAGSSDKLIYAENTSNLNLFNVNLETKNNTSIGMEVKSTTTSLNLFNIDNSVFQGNGSGLKLNATGGYPINNFTVKNSEFKLHQDIAVGSTTNQGLYILNGVTGMYLINNLFYAKIGALNNALLKFDYSSSDLPNISEMSGNTFIQGYSAADGIYFGNIVNVNNFAYNSISYTNIVVDSSSYALNFGFTTTLNINSDVPQNSGGNRICGGSHNWFAKSTGPSTVNPLSYITLNNNDLSFTGRCKTP